MGQPDRERKDFCTILSYSPYDNIAAKQYPAVLAMGGLTDPRVTYWEPAKWIARLRATMTGGGPVLLRTNMALAMAARPGASTVSMKSRSRLRSRLWAVGMAGGGGVALRCRHLNVVLAKAKTHTA